MADQEVAVAAEVVVVVRGDAVAAVVGVEVSVEAIAENGAIFTAMMIGETIVAMIAEMTAVMTIAAMIDVTSVLTVRGKGNLMNTAIATKSVLGLMNLRNLVVAPLKAPHLVAITTPHRKGILSTNISRNLTNRRPLPNIITE